MTDHGIHPLPRLFDLATNMIVPHISRRVRRQLWPLPVDASSTSRIFRCDADKLVTALWEMDDWLTRYPPAKRMEIRQIHQKENWVDLCALEYAQELVFQRFLAWAVYKTGTPDEEEKGHFCYRNGCANVRALLSLPLVVELYQVGNGVIDQGNFGYRASPENDRASRPRRWIYPHLWNYLATFYYPWLPDLHMQSCHPPPKDTLDSLATHRGVQRSRGVCTELWQLLRTGPSLRQPVGSEKCLTLKELFSHLGTRQADMEISPFVHRLTTHQDLGLGRFWALVQQGEFTSPLTSGTPQETRQRYHDDVERLLPDDQDASFRLVRGFLEMQRQEKSNITSNCGSDLDRARMTKHPSGNLEDLARLRAVMSHESDWSRLELFLRWRFLEEGLRLLVDRLFLDRREDFPAIKRPQPPSAFSDRGFSVVLVAEVQLNLTAEQIQHAPAEQQAEEDPLAIWPASAGRPRETSGDNDPPLDRWLNKAREAYHGDNRTRFWLRDGWPRHALFETLLTGEQDHVLLAWLLALTVRPPHQEDSSDLVNRRCLDRLARWIKRVRGDTFRPLAAMANLCLGSPGETNRFWNGLAQRLQTWYGGRPLGEITLDEFLGKVNEWPQPIPEDRTEEAARHFFAVASLRSVNTGILKALRTFGPGENVITIRLLAPERSISGQPGLNLRYQDHADFIGTFVVWKDSGRGREHDIIIEAPSPSAWLHDIHRQKIMIRMLGTALLNQVRTAEHERLAADRAKTSAGSAMAKTLTHEFKKNASQFTTIARNIREYFLKGQEELGREALNRLIRLLLVHESKLRLVHFVIEEGLIERGDLVQMFHRVWAYRFTRKSPHSIAIPLICMLGAAYAIHLSRQERGHDIEPWELMNDSLKSFKLLDKEKRLGIGFNDWRVCKDIMLHLPTETDQGWARHDGKPYPQFTRYEALWLVVLGELFDNASDDDLTLSGSWGVDKQDFTLTVDSRTETPIASAREEWEEVYGQTWPAANEVIDPPPPRVSGRKWGRRGNHLLMAYLGQSYRICWREQDNGCVTWSTTLGLKEPVCFANKPGDQGRSI